MDSGWRYAGFINGVATDPPDQQLTDPMEGPPSEAIRRYAHINEPHLVVVSREQTGVSTSLVQVYFHISILKEVS